MGKMPEKLPGTLPATLPEKLAIGIASPDPGKINI
jgi:hypothetical protein